jgi:hypothetical protein
LLKTRRLAHSIWMSGNESKSTLSDTQLSRRYTHA